MSSFFVSLLKKIPRGNVPARASVALLCLLATGCGCEAYACYNGIDVTLSAIPSTPYRVDMLVAGKTLTPPPEASCNSGESCSQTLHFTTMATRDVTIRVTTDEGTMETHYDEFPYKMSFPDDCHQCFSAALTANVH